MWCPILSSRAPIPTTASFDAPTSDTTDSLVVIAVSLFEVHGPPGGAGRKALTILLLKQASSRQGGSMALPFGTPLVGAALRCLASTATRYRAAYTADASCRAGAQNGSCHVSFLPCARCAAVDRECRGRPC